MPRFQDHQEEVWRQLSEELGGELVDDVGWRQDRVRVEHGGWRVTIDFDAHCGYRLNSVYTRIHAPCAASEFRFRIFHQELAHGIARLLGMQDIQVGDPAFDRAFVIQGSDEDAVRELFGDAALRAAILTEPEAEIALRPTEESLTDDEPGEVVELTLEVPGRVEDVARLRALYDVFSALLDRLHDVAGLEPPRQG
jgi:hypothetical protein